MKKRGFAALLSAVLILSSMAVPGAITDKPQKDPSSDTAQTGYPGNELIEKIINKYGYTNQDETRNEALDKAFLRGSVIFTESQSGELNVDPSGYNAVIRSLSPTGRSALLWSEEENQAYAVFEDTVSPVLPSEERGVPDIYGKRSMMFDTGLLSRWVGKEGITWSHDGKYAVITSFHMAMVLMKFHDPLIIDVTTGEAFLPATWPGSITKEEGAATAVTTCFSKDDRYLYFIQYGKAQSSMYSILRYSFEDDETTLCWTGDTDIYDPLLCETSGGDLIALHTPLSSREEYGVCRFTPAQDGFDCHFIGSGMTLAETTIRPRELSYSANSGYAISKAESPVLESGFGNIFFQCYSPDRDFEGYDRLFAIPVEGSTAAEFLNTEIDAIPDKDRHTAYLAIYLMRLSPDGYYALAFARDRMADKNRLLLIDLETKAFQEVQGVDPDTIDFFLVEKDPVIEWNCNDLVIKTSEGVKTYALR